MTSKERMLTAIRKGKPDCLPVTIHQWQPYHLKYYMNAMSDIEANKACGLDASINYFEINQPVSSNWRESAKITNMDGDFITDYTIETPEGTLTCQEGTNEMTTWVNKHLIKTEDDIYLLKKYRPIPGFNREGAIKTYDALGDGGILRTFIFGKQGGCWQDACELFGVENLIMATYDNPEWVHEFLEILLEQKLTFIDENLRGLPFDLIETGGGASSNTVISPTIHEEFCLPYDRRMHDYLHQVDHKVVYHTCGGMSKITDLIIQNNCDVSETLSPQSVGGDIINDEIASKVYNDFHSHVALIGGMDQFNVLEIGSFEQIDAEVKRLFELYGKDGGYIMSACDHFFKVPKENLMRFAKAAKECVY